MQADASLSNAVALAGRTDRYRDKPRFKEDWRDKLDSFLLTAVELEARRHAANTLHHPRARRWMNVASNAV